MTTPQSRKQPRLNHEVLVSVSSPEGTFAGWGTNLSEGGVFVNAPGAPDGAKLGSDVDILLQLPGQTEIKLKGRVVWAKGQGPEVAEPGVGIQFVAADEVTRHRIVELMDRLAKDLGQQPA